MRRAIPMAVFLIAAPSHAEWRVAKQHATGSMPWGVLAVGEDVYVGHVGYSGHDNVFRYRDGRVAARAKFPGHVVELALAPDGTLYAGNSRKDVVVALDPATLEVRAQLRTGSGPKDLCVSRDGKMLYAGNFNTNTVSAIELASRTERKIVVGAGPRGLDTSGAKLYVASLRASTVSVIDTNTLAVRSTIRGCKGAAHTAVTPDGGQLLVTCYGARHVQVIDTATDKPVRLIEVGAGPNPIAITPDGKQALVGNELADSLSTIDLATWKVTTIALPIKRPVGVVVSPDGKRAYATGRGSTKLVELARD
jgi:YVTN family beta-propeller protein